MQAGPKGGADKGQGLQWGPAAAAAPAKKKRIGAAAKDAQGAQVCTANLAEKQLVSLLALSRPPAQSKSCGDASSMAALCMTGIAAQHVHVL